MSQRGHYFRHDLSSTGTAQITRRLTGGNSVLKHEARILIRLIKYISLLKNVQEKKRTFRKTQAWNSASAVPDRSSPGVNLFSLFF